jgi:hypothetical protein
MQLSLSTRRARLSTPLFPPPKTLFPIRFSAVNLHLEPYIIDYVFLSNFVLSIIAVPIYESALRPISYLGVA